MKPFGKTEEELNANEKKAFGMMLGIATQMMLVEDMFGPLAPLLGPSNDKEIVGTTIFIGVHILNLDSPQTQEEFNTLQEAVEESDYSLKTLLGQYTEDYKAFCETLPEEKKEKSAQLFSIVILDKLGIAHDEIDEDGNLKDLEPQENTTEESKSDS